MGIDLTPLQLDAFKEIANIGGSNAATCLSQLVSAPIKIISPSMSLVSLSNFIESFAVKKEQMFVVAKMEVLGGAPGNMLLILNYNDASYIVDLLLGRKRKNIHEYEMDLVEHQALKHVSILLAASYLYALSKFLRMPIVPGDPVLRSITIKETVEYILTPLAQVAYSGFLIRNKFIEASNNKLEGHLLYLPYQQALDTILVIINEKAGKGHKLPLV